MKKPLTQKQLRANHRNLAKWEDKQNAIALLAGSGMVIIMWILSLYY